MLLKREYRHDAPPDDWTRRDEPCTTCQGKGKVINEAGDGVEVCPAGCANGVRTRMVPPFRAMQVEHTGTSPAQNFSVGFVATGLSEGWIRITEATPNIKAMLILQVEPEALTYEIRRTPGRYCCHCGEKLLDDPRGQLARVHIAKKHSGQPSPDPANPAGYRQVNAYECVLNPEQHARWKVGR